MPPPPPPSLAVSISSGQKWANDSTDVQMDPDDLQGGHREEGMGETQAIAGLIRSTVKYTNFAGDLLPPLVGSTHPQATDGCRVFPVAQNLAPGPWVCGVGRWENGVQGCIGYQLGTFLYVGREVTSNMMIAQFPWM